MARKIVVLQENNPNNSYIEIQSVFWLVVPANQQAYRANASATSAVPGATAGELSAIQTGTVAETVQTTSYPPGTTAATMGADLVSRYNAAQAALNADKRYQFYLSSFDGATWTVGGTG